MINELDDAQMIFSIRELKAMGLSYYQIVKLVNDGHLNKLNRRNYENRNFKGDYNELVYANAFFTKGVVCLLSAASYYGLTNSIPQGIDIAIYKKDKVRTLPNWPNINIYHYSDKRHRAGIKKIAINMDFFYIYDIDKTVADIIYFREKIGIEETKEIIVRYLRKNDKHLNNLIAYTKELGCYKTLKTYMEVLL